MTKRPASLRRAAACAGDRTAPAPAPAPAPAAMNPELFASTIDIDQSCGLSTLIDADHVYIFISAIVRHARPAPIVFATGLRLGVIAKDMQGGELGEARAPFAEAALHADMPYYFEMDLKLRRSRIDGRTITLLLDFVQETQFWLHHLDPGAAVTRTVAYNASEIADMAPANAPCRDADDGAIIPRARHAQDAGCLGLADLMWYQALRASRDPQDRLVCWINLIHIADLVTRASALGAALPPMDAETAAPSYVHALLRGLADRRGPTIDRLADADLARLIQLLGRRKHDAALRQIARHAWHRDISAAARAILAQIGAAARLDDRTHAWLWGEDVLARRSALLADTIRPYVMAAVPARPTLLLDVLGFELRCLATGRLPTAAQLQTAIANDHWTIPPFDRTVGAPPVRQPPAPGRPVHGLVGPRSAARGGTRRQPRRFHRRHRCRTPAGADLYGRDQHRLSAGRRRILHAAHLHDPGRVRHSLHLAELRRSRRAATRTSFLYAHAVLPRHPPFGRDDRGGGDRCYRPACARRRACPRVGEPTGGACVRRAAGRGDDRAAFLAWTGRSRADRGPGHHGQSRLASSGHPPAPAAWRAALCRVRIHARCRRRYRGWRGRPGDPSGAGILALPAPDRA